MKVLILKPSSLGDVVQALPVARLLRQQRPDAEIHWWLNRELTPLLEGDPDIRRVIPFDRQKWGAWGGIPLMWRQIRELRRERYDWVIDLQSLARSAIVARLAGGKRTIGLRDWREGAPLFYGESVPRATYATHAVDWYLSVLSALEVPIHRRFTWLPVRSEVRDRVSSLLPDLGARWIAFLPGARWENKRWPASSFADAARRLVRTNADARIAVFGGAADRALGSEIAAAAGPRALDLTGRLTLPELVEGLRLCVLAVTNDTGPMHIAAALGKPVVGLFGPTEPARTGPYGGGHSILRRDLPCVPCMKSACHRRQDPLACLRDLPVEAVVHTLLDRLAELRSPPCPQPGSP